MAGQKPMLADRVWYSFKIGELCAALCLFWEKPFILCCNFTSEVLHTHNFNMLLRKHNALHKEEKGKAFTTALVEMDFSI